MFKVLKGGYYWLNFLKGMKCDNVASKVPSPVSENFLIADIWLFFSANFLQLSLTR